LTRPVLLVVSTLDGSGPGRVFATLAAELRARGRWEPVLVTTHGVESSPLLDELLAVGLPVEHLGMRAIWDLRGATRFADLVRRIRPAVVHTRTIRADLVGRTAARHGAAVLNNIVNMYPDDSVALHGPVAGTVLTALVRRTQRWARVLVANANTVADNVRATFGADGVRVVYDGLDLARFQEAAPADLSGIGVRPTDRVALSVARLHPQKGLEDLVAATALLGNEPDLHVVVAGDGPDRAMIQTAVDRAGLAGRFHLLGNREDVPALLARAELFVLSSRFEGLPSGAIEAMAAGLPVVATRAGGLPELVDDGTTGWLVPVGAPVQLADAIRDALHTDLASVGAAGRRKANEQFAVASMAERFSDIYDEIAS
jgi:glycosyltransferase involved in cell wall biosynthesis